MDFKNTMIAGFLLLNGALLSVTFAATFNVADESGFQDALNTAAANSENDTINVIAGTYNVATTLTYWSTENHTLMVSGSGAGSAVLDGGSTTQIAEWISVGDIGHLTVQHLIFRNGSSAFGGAVYVETDAASITIHECEFNSNSSTDVGGAVNAYSTTGDIFVSNCLFEGNESGRAGGLFAQTESGLLTSLTDCVFESNSCTIDGGGTMLYPLGAGASLIVEDNTFTNNQAGNFGGGCWSRMPAGNSTVTYSGNILTDNTTLTGDGAGTYIEIQSGTLSYSKNKYDNNDSGQDGGGAWIWNGTGTMNLTSNSFTGNHSTNNGGGASLITDAGTMIISRNIFDSNTSGNVGGGASLATTSGVLIVSNDTFYGNSASEGGGIYFYLDQGTSQADVFSNILWHDTPQGIAYSGAQTVTMRYSDVENGTGEPWFGVGCINADPLFADPINGDFNLTWANFPTQDATRSPCIDAGDPASPPDPDNTIADIGAFFFAQSTGIPDDQLHAAQAFRLDQNYPNPFSLKTVIEYSVSVSQNVEIRIHDVSGRLVKSLVREPKPAGDHAILWDARDTRAGVYFCLLEIEGHRITKKLVLLE